SALQPLFDKADLLIGNLETPIAGEEMTFTHERYCFNSPDEFAQMLKACHFDLVCLANNHCMDRGEAGIDATLDHLDRIGLAHTGIYRNKSERVPTVLAKNGIRIGIVNYTYGTNAFAHHRFLSEKNSPKVNLFQPEETLSGSIHLLESMETIGKMTEKLYKSPSKVYDAEIAPYLAKLQADIDAAKDVSDFIIVVMHSGGQYNPDPDPYSRLLAAKIRVMGANCIIGHHPHVIHPALFEDGIFTAYSLGNLFCTPSICQDQTGAAYSSLLTLTLEKEDGNVTLTNGSFHLTRTVEPAGDIPQAVPADISCAPANEQLFYAERFSQRQFESPKPQYTLFGKEK
ncbi:MAG: CapA family protein, partial [Clostridia bacterium]|nr:CapA family protein [Clostridia bacterium]